ncbi:hypothetical protein N7532_002052 [Penicillium argentinense]|uniref:Zn(2)-C6 fungal-type domain-containing protein n=1 Tax=Penicillium argentinense TaxID=1131581 RepID=A0A9W9G579_9EURO|nr:uncharacterized protein N7532_002052 [Penicillium argentinense]KAJ5111517.1 hypothetical protein N7532_002052 [Penicillium argentinense]
MNLDPKFPRKRESRTRAPTACQTCRLRKTRCDNTRPVCSYCAIQGVECVYPEASPHPVQTNFESANHEILQRLGQIASLLEDLKQDSGSSSLSGRSARGSLLELATGTQNSSPLADPFASRNHPGSATSIEDRADDHDPLTLYAANSPEYMLRWPIFNRVIPESERHVRSFLLDSLDNQPHVLSPPRQAEVGSSLDDIQHLCRKYIVLIHRRNPVVEAETLERYARQVTLQGLGWDGPSCQVLLACALACCTSSFVPLSEIPNDLDNISSPPQSDANVELAEAYFHAAEQRLGSLNTSPTDIQCFLLAGSYHSHAIRPLQAWFCFQQASCRLEVRLRSLRREQWTADIDYYNLESRLYWSCIQAEHEMQAELPLWGSCLESLGYANQFPTFPRTSSASISPADRFGDNKDIVTRSWPEMCDTDDEKGWRFYIGSICNRRTVNDMLIDMWRGGEQDWVNNIHGVVERTSAAAEVIYSWYQMSLSGLPSPTPDNQDLEFLLYSRYRMGLEKIYRPILYLAVHYSFLPSYLQNNTQLFQEVFNHAQKALQNCAALIPNLWYHFRHEWIWNMMRCTFGAAIQIIAAVLSRLQYAASGGWCLVPPHNWPALVRLSIRTLRAWSGESIDLDMMRSTLERMYQGTCLLAGIRSDMYPS